MFDGPLSLDDANQRLQAIVANVPQCIWVKSANGCYLSCNQRYENVIGRSQAELLGKTDADFFGPHLAEQYRASDELCLGMHYPLIYEAWVHSADGQHRTCLEITKTVLRNAQGQVAGLIGMAHDITRRKQLTEFEQMRSRALELVARAVPLNQLLNMLALSLEQLLPDNLCAIWRQEADKKLLRLVAAPSLPAETVAFLAAQPMDLPTLRQWQDIQHNPRWSSELRAADGVLMGALVIYQKPERATAFWDAHMPTQMARLASLALEQHRNAQLLKDSEDRFRALAEHTPEAILVHAETVILYANPAALRLFGASEAGQLLGTRTTARIHPDFVQQQAQRLQQIKSGAVLDAYIESRFLRLDGSVVDVEVQGTAIVYGGKPAVHVSVRDITQRKRVEQQLNLSAKVFAYAREGILITDAQVRIVDVNAAFTRITGYEREQVLGQNPRLLGSGQHDKAFFSQLWSGLSRDGYWSGEIRNRRQGGQLYVQLQTVIAVKDNQDQVSHYAAIFSDITDRKAQELRMTHLAHFDALTGLPNRVLKADRLQQAMAQCARREQKLALALIDLDGFKAINDTHGHEAGDHLLEALAQRMKSVLREGDTLARVGGDEFSAVMVDLDNPQDCDLLLQRLLEAASQPVVWGPHRLQVSASVGVTFYPQLQDVSMAQLERQADQAMYRAKQAGKNRRHVYEDAL